MGVVYVFNASTQAVRLYINDPQRSGPPIQPVSKNSKYPYTPFSVQVATSDNPMMTGVFRNGQPNSITVQIQGGQSNPVIIPAVSPSTVDLWLYLFADFAVLFDTAGRPLAQESIDWGFTKYGGPASAVGGRLKRSGRRK